MAIRLGKFNAGEQKVWRRVPGMGSPTLESRARPPGAAAQLDPSIGEPSGKAGWQGAWRIKGAGAIEVLVRSRWTGDRTWR